MSKIFSMISLSIFNNYMCGEPGMIASDKELFDTILDAHPGLNTLEAIIIFQMCKENRSQETFDKVQEYVLNLALDRVVRSADKDLWERNK